jgi:hypothetical protein
LAVSESAHAPSGVSIGVQLPIAAQVVTFSAYSRPKLVGALAVSAAVVGPQIGHGFGTNEAAPPPVAARRQDHRTLMEHLTGLIGRSSAVLAVHQRGTTPYLEIVLWLGDEDRSGRAEPAEVAIVSHSRIMQTLTLYEWAGGKAPAEGALAIVAPGAPAFCNAWRADRHVRPQVILAGVSDLAARPLESPVAGRLALEITVTWAGDPSDGPDVASAVVDAAAAAPEAWR